MAAVDPEQCASEVEAEPAPDGRAIAKRIGPVWSSTRTRERLGLVTRQALNSRRARGTILGVKTREGGVFYPVFQFRRRGEHVEVHPNLVPVLKTLKDIDGWTIAAMLHSADPGLGMSAVEWVESGGDQTRLEAWAVTVKHELTSGSAA